LKPHHTDLYLAEMQYTWAGRPNRPQDSTRLGNAEAQPGSGRAFQPGQKFPWYFL